MYKGYDIIATLVILAVLIGAAMTIAVLTGCAAYNTMPDRAQVMCINEFRRSVGLDTLAMEDMR